MDPIGDWREDVRLAVLQSFIQNRLQQLFPEKGKPAPKPTTADDFILDWANEKDYSIPSQSVEQMKEQLMNLVNNQNKQVRKLHQNKPKNIKK